MADRSSPDPPSPPGDRTFETFVELLTRLLGEVQGGTVHVALSLDDSSDKTLAEPPVVPPAQVGDFQTTDFQTSHFQATDSQASNSQANNSQATDSQASNSQTAAFQASNSQATDSQATNSQTATFQASNSQATDSQATNSQTAAFQASNSQATDSQASNSQTAAFQASNSQAIDRTIPVSAVSAAPAVTSDPLPPGSASPASPHPASPHPNSPPPNSPPLNPFPVEPPQIVPSPSSGLTASAAPPAALPYHRPPISGGETPGSPDGTGPLTTGQAGRLAPTVAPTAGAGPYAPGSHTPRHQGSPYGSPKPASPAPRSATSHPPLHQALHQWQGSMQHLEAQSYDPDRLLGLLLPAVAETLGHHLHDRRNSLAHLLTGEGDLPIEERLDREAEALLAALRPPLHSALGEYFAETLRRLNQALSPDSSGDRSALNRPGTLGHSPQTLPTPLPPLERVQTQEPKRPSWVRPFWAKLGLGTIAGLVLGGSVAVGLWMRQQQVAADRNAQDQAQLAAVAQIKANLAEIERLHNAVNNWEGVQLETVMEGGGLTLKGSVGREADRQNIAQLFAQIPDIGPVNNQIQVKKPDIATQVYFYANATTVTPRDISTKLLGVKQTLDQFPSVQVRILGYADPTEPLELAQERAEAVQNILADQGIDRRRLPIETPSGFPPGITANQDLWLSRTVVFEVLP